MLGVGPMQTLTLRDGRVLAFDVVGDPAGYPVVNHHGGGGCRLLRPPDDSVAVRARLRLILVDRPGYGGSTRRKGRTLLDWADDVAELADHLDLDRFAVMGGSTGSPYALAVAYRLGQRVSHGVLAPALGPLDDSGALDELDPGTARGFRMRHWPWLLQLSLAPVARLARDDPGSLIDKGMDRLAPPDRALYADPAIRAMAEAQTAEAWRTGPYGTIDDIRAVYSWGFRPEQVSQHFDLFHGDADTTIVPAMAQRLVRRLPDAHLQMVEHAGHAVALTHWDTIAKTLASFADTQLHDL